MKIAQILVSIIPFPGFSIVKKITFFDRIKASGDTTQERRFHYEKTNSRKRRTGVMKGDSR
jgi:hypothetical protein